jgi:hypothetical protein
MKVLLMLCLLLAIKTLGQDNPAQNTLVLIKNGDTIRPTLTDAITFFYEKDSLTLPVMGGNVLVDSSVFLKPVTSIEVRLADVVLKIPYMTDDSLTFFQSRFLFDWWPNTHYFKYYTDSVATKVHSFSIPAGRKEELNSLLHWNCECPLEVSIVDPRQ